MDTDGTCLLGNTGNRRFDLFAGLHDQVAELIDDNNDERHELMSFLRIQMAGDKFGIIFFNVTHVRFHQQFVTVVHFLTNRVKRHDNLRAVCNYSLIRIRQFRQVMTFQIRIDTELNHLRVDQHKLQFRRMLSI